MRLGSAPAGEGVALNLSGPQSVFKYQSGRVIALGRVMLATLFLLSIWLDQSQPAKAPEQTYEELQRFFSS